MCSYGSPGGLIGDGPEQEVSPLLQGIGIRKESVYGHKVRCRFLELRVGKDKGRKLNNLQ